MNRLSEVPLLANPSMSQVLPCWRRTMVARTHPHAVCPEEPPSFGGVSKGASPVGPQRPRGCAPLPQTRNLGPIPACPGLLFPAAPAFEPPLCAQRLLARGKGFRVQQLNWSPCGGMPGDLGPLMLGEALLEVLGVAHIVRLVCAPQQVDPEAHHDRIHGNRGSRQAPFETAAEKTRPPQGERMYTHLPCPATEELGKRELPRRGLTDSTHVSC